MIENLSTLLECWQSWGNYSLISRREKDGNQQIIPYMIFGQGWYEF